MSVTVEDFLEHHGVKGQKWGIRNVQQELHDLKTKIDKNKKLKTGLKIGGGIAAVAAVAAGAIVADRLLRQHRLMKMTDLRTAWNRGTYPVPNFPPTILKTPVSALPKISAPKTKSGFLSTIMGAKKVEQRLDQTLKPGAKVTTADVNRAVANIGKTTYQTAKTTKAKDLFKVLSTVRIKPKG